MAGRGGRWQLAAEALHRQVAGRRADAPPPSSGLRRARRDARSRQPDRAQPQARGRRGAVARDRRARRCAHPSELARAGGGGPWHGHAERGGLLLELAAKDAEQTRREFNEIYLPARRTQEQLLVELEGCSRRLAAVTVDWPRSAHHRGGGGAVRQWRRSRAAHGNRAANDPGLGSDRLRRRAGDDPPERTSTVLPRANRPARSATAAQFRQSGGDVLRSPPARRVSKQGKARWSRSPPASARPRAAC